MRPISQPKNSRDESGSNEQTMALPTPIFTLCCYLYVTRGVLAGVWRKQY